MPAISLYDCHGRRKYLTNNERKAFATAALRSAPPIQTFCLTLLYTGARVSEALALTPERIDRANSAIIFETLKRRKRGVFRAIPVPKEFIERLARVHRLSPSLEGCPEVHGPLWKWSRTTAWKHVKAVMEAAGVPSSLASPKAARHAFAVDAIQLGVALNLVQRWMGHARIETTAIYADVTGDEERSIAERMWVGLQHS